jgi:hypothetical protein
MNWQDVLVEVPTLTAPAELAARDPLGVAALLAAVDRACRDLPAEARRGLVAALAAGDLPELRALAEAAAKREHWPHWDQSASEGADLEREWRAADLAEIRKAAAAVLAALDALEVPR